MNNEQIKLLLVDDEEFNRELYADSFREVGIEPWEASNGQECLELVKLHKPNLILLDIQMPVMDGLQTLKAIKADPETYGTPKIVMLTSMMTDPTIDKSYEQDADGYLIKHELLPTEVVTEAVSIFKEGKKKDLD
ncbi:response regulator [Candidatus Dojkabacteria bacterium]|uniref:Response regulator n=1 Tax=Candidatus Dojkabacteria bacterium TaxID=2099670 RepID=A0A955RID0_9BACT|nr:response regulator [Candidatus Dojkabacteria bacterium]